MGHKDKSWTVPDESERKLVWRRAGYVVAVIAVAAVTGLLAWSLPSGEIVAVHATHRPAEAPGEGYVSSDACRACHPQQYDTWQASYHPKMTRVASPESVIGEFGDLY